jgi:predicted membrane GTPase involved in stress response
MATRSDLRNIAIVAHVDHGKEVVDALRSQVSDELDSVLPPTNIAA